MATEAHAPAGRVALVTGGSGAIGSAVCRALARDGFDVAFTYGRNKAAAARTASEVEALGRLVRRTCVDVADGAAVAAFVADARDWGPISAVVTAAAPVATQKFVGTIEPEELRDQLHQDTLGFHHVAVAALPSLRETKGSIVAVATVANRRYVLRDVLSTAPKAAVEALVRALAAEEGRYGVRANAVGVGILDEGMSHTLIELGQVRERDMQHALRRIPLREFGTAADVAEAVAFLLSDRARYITGQWLDVDGGYGV